MSCTCVYCHSPSVNSYPPLVEAPPLVPEPRCGRGLSCRLGDCRDCHVYDPRNHRTIIAFTGLAGSGKSTAAAHLCDVHGFERVRFAGPLKSMMAALGLTHEQIEGSEKETPCSLLGGRTPRYAMQQLGTEWGRDIIDRDLWIRAWQHAVDRLPPTVPVVVDDCRFGNEAAAVRAAGGVLVKIVRDGAGAGAAGHSSEGQDLGVAAVTIRNDATPEDLQYRLDVAVRDLSWAMAGTH